MKLAACTIFENPADGRILVVWNKRAGGWCLPGGLVEPGERPIDAAVRENCEEVAIETGQLAEVYDAPYESSRARADRVHIFAPYPRRRWAPRAMEPGSPVTWLTREELLATSPFKDFYEGMFAALDQRACVVCGRRGLVHQDGTRASVNVQNPTRERDGKRYAALPEPAPMHDACGQDLLDRHSRH